MTLVQRIITIAVVSLGTMLTRFLPFLIFKSETKTPKFIEYLGKALPSAVFAMLVIYCLKDVNIFVVKNVVPEMIGVGVTVIVHLLKKNYLLSMLSGTAIYMFLVQAIFV